jgi:hypothetical protein
MNVSSALLIGAALSGIAAAIAWGLSLGEITPH